MEKRLITIPARAAPALSLPDRSLADGSPAAEHVAVHALGSSLMRRAVRISLPLDPTSAAVARRTERFDRIRRYAVRPAMLLALAVAVVGAFRYLVVQDAAGRYPWWIVVPLAVVALMDQVLESAMSRSALAQHPRGMRASVRLAEIPEPVALEIVRLNPDVVLEN